METELSVMHNGLIKLDLDESVHTSDEEEEATYDDHHLSRKLNMRIIISHKWLFQLLSNDGVSQNLL
jgi:hypothetical protein